MPDLAHQDGVDAALDCIERGILPNISVTLEALLDAAGAARPSGGDAALAAELQAIAAQLAAVVLQVEAVTAPPLPVVEWPLRISA